MKSTTSAGSKKKMLLIDDETKLLLGLKAVMTREGYEVISAHDGNEGVRLAREHIPDIIICDVMMPAPNGFQLKKILSNDMLTAQIPFIFLTARTLEADKIAGLKQGADDYVTKPFNTDELIARVEAIFRRNEIGRQDGLKDQESNLEKVRRNISSNLGHEFRTPLTIILANLDLAIREKFKGRTDDLDWYLETSMNSAQKLSMLVDDLILLNDLDLAKINTMRRPINLDFHFKSPIQEVLARYTQKNLDVQITIEDGTILHAPDLEFSHAVAHLVDNAFKFSPEGARITIHLGKNGIGGCVLTIENEGSFIAPELREKVFERYFQIYQGDDRPYNGLGVGLTIVRAIVEACRGSVKILDSEIGCKVQLIYPPAAVDWPRD